ncbi:MAG: hypothetical protein QW763_06295, partial [Archaeoglobaceae archaeon]
MGKGAEKGVSLLVEYLILMGILSVFVVVMSLQIHDTLSEVQLSRVVENNFADVASQISAIYTDYVLILPDNGSISTKIEMPSTIGKLGYSAKLNKTGDVAHILVEGGKYSAASGLGLAKFISNSGRAIVVGTGGEIISFQTEAEKKEEKPKVEYEKSIECPFIPKPRIEFIPSSVALEDNFGLKVSFVNKNEIKKSIRWNVTLWNGSVISGSETDKLIPLRLNNENEVRTHCVKINSSANDYECNATIKAEIVELPHCNASDANKLLVSLKPEESNPYLVCKKWIEPRIVSPGDVFDVNLRIEGRGFFVEGATNLSVVHVIDVSGSMIWPTIFWNDSRIVIPNVITKTINLSQSGKLEIYAYTTDRLPQWYSNELCRCTETSCPWWNNGYDSSFIKLYLDGFEVGNTYSSGQVIGKNYTNNNAQAGSYKLEVLALAPEKIKLSLVVKFNNTEILNETYEYLNREKISFELPYGTTYTFLAITGIQNLPNWDMEYKNKNSPQWSDYILIENYNIEGNSRFWEYRWRLCGDRSYSYQQGSLNAWIILPNGSKQFLLKGENMYWFQARNNYGINGIDADVFIPNPQTGKYEFVVVPTTKNPVTFTATALIKRIDAAKLAGITFNNMLGEKDFVGLTTFTTDAQRIEVNSSPLKYMTNDKSAVNSRILGLRAELATDHPDGLYHGSRVFPIWNETGNNCKSCIAGT